MKTVLITGGTGFVGANLALRLSAEGHQVTLLVRPGHATWRLPALSEARLIEADLASSGSLVGVIDKVAPDWIFHLAAYGAYPAQTDLDRMVRTNLQGGVSLVQAASAVGFEAFVNAGSSSEYGCKPFPPAETEWLEPNSAYAWTKASMTLFCRYIASATGQYLATLRLYSVYGPYEEPTRLVPSMIARGLRGELPPLADPGIARDFVYVDDVADAFLAAAVHPTQEPGPVYNVGTGAQHTLADVVEVARRHLPINQAAQWGTMANRSWDTNVWVCDNRKIGDELGWRPRTTFDEGFGRFVAWYRAHPELCARYEGRPDGDLGAGA